MLKTVAYASLEDKVVLITGGASGIGESIVEKFLEQGSKVAFIDKEQKLGNDLVSKFDKFKYKALFKECDLVDISKGGWDLEISSNYSNRLEISSVQKAARYYRLQVKDQPGVIAKISSLFGEKGISIDALIQHEARSKEELESVPLVIISGEITDNEAEKLKDVLEGLPEVLVGVKKFRIHPGRE